MKVGDIMRVKAGGTTDRLGTIKYDGVKVKVVRIEKGYSVVDPLSEYHKKLRGCVLKGAIIPNWALWEDKNELAMEVE